MDQPKALSLKGLRVQNFKRVHLVELKTEGAGLIEIRGRNGQGKSSVIDALWAALGGSRVSPDRPIRDGEDNATCEVQLGDILVIRVWDSRGTRLEVHDHGRKMKSPQALLDSLVSQFIDPCQFLALRAEDQADQVLAMTDLSDSLYKIDEEELGAVETRRDIGRELKRAQGALEAAQADIVDVPEGALSIEEAADQLNAANTAQAKCHDAEREARLARGAETELDAAVKNIEKQIVELQSELKIVRKRQVDAAEKAESAEKTFADLPRPNTEEAQAALTLAKSSASAVAARNLAKQRSSDLDEVKERHTKAEEKVKAVRDDRAALLDAAEFPIEGLSYDADSKTLVLRGVPFEQASSAERLKAAIELAIAGSPGVRVLFVREASVLDSASLAHLQELAEKHGYQVILEIVDDDPAGSGVYIEDGRVLEPKQVGGEEIA